MTKRAMLGSLCCAVALMTQPVSAQQALGGATTTIGYDFTDFTARGFSPTPAAGQLDSDEWIATGASDAAPDFGGNAPNGGDYGRGTSMGGVSAGGVYAFDHDASPVSEDYSLGVQPSGADFTPGDLQLRIRNATGAPLRAIELLYSFLYRNDGGYGTHHSVRVVRESDGEEVSVPELSIDTPVAAATAPLWVSTARSAIIDLGTIAIPDGENFIVVFAFDDAPGGGGVRDEIAFDDVMVALTDCGNGTMDAGEACDDGNVTTETTCAYGTATCMTCSADCSMPLNLTGSFCGDGSLDRADGETCDDGNTASGDGCSSSCALEVLDGGTIADDAGIVIMIDAGLVDHDAGLVDHDAGLVDHDAGLVDHDAGAIDHDAGVDHDAGTIDHDASAIGPDAGDVMVDAGHVHDVDSGSAERDAGSIAADAGRVEVDAGTPANAGGGCSCRAVGSSGQNGTAALALLGVLGLAVTRRRWLRHPIR